MDSRDQKMEQDHSAAADAAIQQSESLSQSGNLDGAIEKLLAIEKQARTGGDMISTGRILVQIMKLYFAAGKWDKMQENLSILSKKRGQLKQATVKMVDEVMLYVDKTPNIETKLALIDTIRTVTEGKIFVEIQRARITKTLADLKEKEGKINEAADILQELQVETFGSMEKREKIEFFLEQMRLCMAKKDYLRTMIISRKISTKSFAEESNSDLKLKFYELMVSLGMAEERYLDVCKYFREVFATKSIMENEAQWPIILQNAALYCILAPYDKEQAEIIQQIKAEPYMRKHSKITPYHDLVRSFTVDDVLRWPRIEESWKKELESTMVFDPKGNGAKLRWTALHDRIVEHNIRVIAKHYTRITTTKLAQLLDLNEMESEKFVSRLVVNGTIPAKINRPGKIINFSDPTQSLEAMQRWRSDVNDLLGHVVKAKHLIAREEMIANTAST